MCLLDRPLLLLRIACDAFRRFFYSLNSGVLTVVDFVQSQQHRPQLPDLPWWKRGNCSSFSGLNCGATPQVGLSIFAYQTAIPCRIVAQKIQFARVPFKLRFLGRCVETPLQWCLYTFTPSRFLSGGALCGTGFCGHNYLMEQQVKNFINANRRLRLSSEEKIPHLPESFHKHKVSTFNFFTNGVFCGFFFGLLSPYRPAVFFLKRNRQYCWGCEGSS